VILNVMYRIILDDGSDAVLSHSGVKGMKWGVWNEETKRRRAGGSDKSRQRKSDMAAAAKSAAISAGLTALRTGGNPGITIAAFGTAYASNRIAQHAVRKGKPAIDKLVKNENARPWVEFAARSATATLVNMGLQNAGSAAVNTLMGYAVDSAYTPTAHSLPGNLVGVQAHDHTHGVGVHGGSLTNQLSNADIPDTLKNK
jgi:hypothetical protein